VSVRIVHNWNLLLVEETLAVNNWYANSPAHGCKLAADYCQNYAPSDGTSPNGPSRTKLLEMARFMFAGEAQDLENSD
jgi:phage tail sheath gpL-like